MIGVSAAVRLFWIGPLNRNENSSSCGVLRTVSERAGPDELSDETNVDEQKTSLFVPSNMFLKNPIPFSHGNQETNIGKIKWPTDREYDILFVGCYLPYGGLDEVVANKGDFQYRDIWRREFWDMKIHFTHQARVNSADALIKQSKFVVFGGGGLIYNSLDRDNGAAELKLLMKWHDILVEQSTPYAMASIGLQPEKFDRVDLGKLEMETLDDGLFKIVKPFIMDAVFVSSRSPTDRRLISQWNPHSYYYPDLVFTIQRLGIAAGAKLHENALLGNDAKLPGTRDLLITVGLPIHFRSVVAELEHLQEIYTHHHVILAEGDKSDTNFTNIGLQQPVLVHNKYLQQDNMEFGRAMYVYSARFHGFISAHLNHVPHVVPMLQTWKLSTFTYHDDLDKLAFGHIKMIRDVLAK